MVTSFGTLALRGRWALSDALPLFRIMTANVYGMLTFCEVLQSSEEVLLCSTIAKQVLLIELTIT